VGPTVSKEPVNGMRRCTEPTYAWLFRLRRWISSISREITNHILVTGNDLYGF
jgi:hypothetical protein